MVKIVDRSDERIRENSLYIGMLERAVRMFGAKSVRGLDNLRITVYNNADVKSELAVISVDVISSRIKLYDAGYLTRVKKLASDYESMVEREFTIELEYK